MSHRRTLPLIAVTLLFSGGLVAALLAGPAGRPDPAFAAPPSQCPETIVKDATGDGTAAGGALPNNDAIDIIGGWAGYDADGTLSAFVQVANMAIPSQGTSYSYGFNFSNGAKNYRAIGFIDSSGGGIYDNREQTDTNGTNSVPATGEIVLGPKGGIRISIGSQFSGDDGNKLSKFNATTGQGFGTSGVALTGAADSTPTTAGPWVVGTCGSTPPGGGGTTGAATTTPAPSSTADSPPPSTSGGGTTTSGGRSQQAAPRLGLAFSKIGGRAKGRKSVVIKVRSLQGKTIKKVAAVLLRAKGTGRGKVVGRTAKPVTIKGKGTLVVKIRGTLVKGKYLLVVTGRLADGRTATQTKPVTFR